VGCHGWMFFIVDNALPYLDNYLTRYQDDPNVKDVFKRLNLLTTLLKERPASYKAQRSAAKVATVKASAGMGDKIHTKFLKENMRPGGPHGLSNSQEWDVPERIHSKIKNLKLFVLCITLLILEDIGVLWGLLKVEKWRLWILNVAVLWLCCILYITGKGIGFTNATSAIAPILFLLLFVAALIYKGYVTL
jgi:hypothetical protein